MNWEAVTGIATAFTGLVILVTALGAMREVRLAGEHAQALRDQLEHLRDATRFEGALAVFKELDTPIQIEARRFVTFELVTEYAQEVPSLSGTITTTRIPHAQSPSTLKAICTSLICAVSTAVRF